MEEQKQIRCAIYTRKSTDEGLEKEFNTLEAQREAGENFVMSMKHQGWVILPERYDDGGFSGGNLKRPALKRLMADVEKGIVDMIVVYKIDRLTRSLLDFAQLVQTFEKNNCSFVSVTQHFNTCDSMGKLTLNKQSRRMMDAWNVLYPVTPWECTRAKRIEEIQGNTNPFVKEPCIEQGLYR